MTTGTAAAARVAGYQMRDVIRSRWLIAYTLFFLVLTDALFRFGGGGSRALLSLVDIVLFIVPLVSIVFGTMYLYNAREFVELILAQPIRRRAVFCGLFAGLVGPLAASFVVGVGIPFAIHGEADAIGTLLVVLTAGTLLTLVFGAIALLIALRTDDRLKGLGLAIGVWLLAAVVYDGVVLLLASIFADHALEHPMLAAMLANPVDLARVVLLLRFDIAALLGYTGAVFQQFFGGARGTVIAVGALFVWIVTPLALASRAFARKDF